MSSTLAHKIYLVKRCYNVAETFVSNEHTVIRPYNRAIYERFENFVQRCKNVRYYSLGILQKKHILLE